jgi:hypothetical protein
MLQPTMLQCWQTSTNNAAVHASGGCARRPERTLRLLPPPPPTLHPLPPPPGAGTKVEAVQGSQAGQPARVMLSDGRVVAARRGVVVAADGPEARRLLGSALEVGGGRVWGEGRGARQQGRQGGGTQQLVRGAWTSPGCRCRCPQGKLQGSCRAPDRRSAPSPPRPQAAPSKAQPGVGTACVYFKAPRAPRSEPILYLNGTEAGLVNNCCFPSTVAPSYAPPGQVSTPPSPPLNCPGGTLLRPARPGGHAPCSLLGRLCRWCFQPPLLMPHSRPHAFPSLPTSLAPCRNAYCPPPPGPAGAGVCVHHWHPGRPVGC